MERTSLGTEFLKPLYSLLSGGLREYPTSLISLLLSVSTNASLKTVEKPGPALPKRTARGPLPPLAHFEAEIHPLVEEITAEVDDWFLEHWPFESEKARKRFVAAGFSRVTCLYYPLALDDRIHFACRLLTILFLIDDILEDMSFEDGRAYNDHLMPLMRGDVLPDRSIPVEWMTYDLWDSMRKFDQRLADEILEPTFEFMRAQTDKQRLTINELGAYLEYREKDVGKALLCSLMRFAMNLALTPAELESVVPVERNAAKHLSVLNDIYSWEKELIQSREGHSEGSAICSSVAVVADECSLSYSAAKNVLWVMCREWEIVHKQLVKERINAATGCSRNVELYMQGMEYQISGNERWSESTPRYILPSSTSA